MKKLIFKARYVVFVFSIILISIYITGCQTEDVTTDEDTSVQAETATSKSIPLNPDYIPPNVPNPPIFDRHCVVRLAYLSYLERCPENASVVNYWLGVLDRDKFAGLAAGFISSPEASQRWNSRYHAFLNRNNLSSSQVAKKVYIAYQGLLLREPDVNGGIYWTTILQNTNITFLANAIGSSAEFERRLARISTECTNAANQCTF